MQSSLNVDIFLCMYTNTHQVVKERDKEITDDEAEEEEEEEDKEKVTI